MSHSPKFPAGRWVAFGVAAIATGSSIAISVLAGAERGGTAAERWIWISIGLTMLLSAHLIPAIARDAKSVARIVAWLLWLAAMVSTGYTHSTFFLAAQQNAGEVRAGQVRVPEVTHDGISTRNSITALLRQQARLQGALDQSEIIKCVADCRVLTVRRQALRDQLDPIKGQLDEARRAEQAEDRQGSERSRALALQDERRGDPVSTRLSAWLHVPMPTIDLALAIFFGWLLESVACFSWSIVLSGVRPSDLPMVKTDVDPRIDDATAEKLMMPMHLTFVLEVIRLAANDSCATEHAIERYEEAGAAFPAVNEAAKVDMDPGRSEANDEIMLRQALKAGIATTAIADITRVLRCSEGRALALRRKIAATSPQLLVLSAG